MDQKEFGQYLKSLRKDKKLTIRQVELYANVSNSYLSMIENGKRDIPSPEILQKLSKVYDIDYNTLMKKAGYVDSDTSKYEDDLEQEFPEGVQVLRRASKELSPKAKKKMLKMMELFLEEDE
ncbi:helix-turn-helix domain-containing protein [Senegalia massiliensis]|uniref:XRE family transcriptional regulator n=1 Tax=Senegalia massiliensis TaxID=1720316 RepID=A0A845QTC3_9CLOT|nr:helix-turn-helix transcriptional regulator [Senegalia massiliensis]NBI05795.1 XRE family transcriptional regulator [Senegalia massiliensis]